jgi:hypothetical protein
MNPKLLPMMYSTLAAQPQRTLYVPPTPITVPVVLGAVSIQRSGRIGAAKVSR